VGVIQEQRRMTLLLLRRRHHLLVRLHRSVATSAHTTDAQITHPIDETTSTTRTTTDDHIGDD
jgi:hypothetical protein